jgi:hypothetical protein
MATVYSKNKWNDTNIRVVAGRTYSYRAKGQWKDKNIECDADGFTHVWMDLSGWMIKRVPSAKWFQLIATVGKDKSHVIKLGTSGRFKAPRSGTLWAFANDASFAYANNSGAVELDVDEDR